MAETHDDVLVVVGLKCFARACPEGLFYGVVCNRLLCHVHFHINWRHDRREMGEAVGMTSNLKASRRNTCM